MDLGTSPILRTVRTGYVSPPNPAMGYFESGDLFSPNSFFIACSYFFCTSRVSLANSSAGCFFFCQVSFHLIPLLTYPFLKPEIADHVSAYHTLATALKISLMERLFFHMYGFICTDLKFCCRLSFVADPGPVCIFLMAILLFTHRKQVLRTRPYLPDWFGYRFARIRPHSVSRRV